MSIWKLYFHNFNGFPLFELFCCAKLWNSSFEISTIWRRWFDHQAEGGVCELFRVPRSGEWLERPNICRLQSREVKPSKNQKFIEKYWKTKKLGVFSWRGSGKFWIFCPWKSLKTYKEMPLYTPYRLRKCTFSDHQKNLYRARKRIWEYRTVLKTS